MARFLIILTAVIVCFDAPVHAAEPDCGRVDRGVLDDVYDAADDARRIRDVRPSLEALCASLERADDSRSALSTEQKRRYDDIVADVERDFIALRAPLILTGSLRNAEIEGDLSLLDTARLVNTIGDARRNIEEAHRRLSFHREALDRIIGAIENTR